ncbi:MAG: FHA domain-containing protein [Chloroflexi bacterium]|nr:MAG: FHA domain-containing protein [Chloroflexota bacterium]
MPEQFPELLKTAALALLIAVLWAGTVTFTFEDTRRRELSSGAVFGWVATSVLLPFIGFIFYLVYLSLSYLIRSSMDQPKQQSRRITGYKREPEGRKRLPTVYASGAYPETHTQAYPVDDYDNFQMNSPARNYQMVVSQGPDQGTRFAFNLMPLTIGRGDEVEVPLDKDLTVSRKHAMLIEQNGLVRIRDLKSRHGTQVNGLRVEEIGLKSGDIIRIGQSELIFTVQERYYGTGNG